MIRITGGTLEVETKRSANYQSVGGKVTLAFESDGDADLPVLHEIAQRIYESLSERTEEQLQRLIADRSPRRPDNSFAE